ncbi:MAG TPA: hypothetical protein VFR73_12065 [Hyphomicrobiaceae bacterium]|jgi:hypothetical protein|nr:hypothetical protein [Hyphomicrobiaceae bacterium]
MLGCFLILASIGAGFAQAPWWFWLVGGMALAFLSLTDPNKRRAIYGPFGYSGTLALSAVVSLATGCLASASAFAMGRIIWWTLPT